MGLDADKLIEIPGGPFLLGADYDGISPALRESDQAKSLGLGAVLASTPARWVELPTFSIMPRMVTNGEYLEFWNSVHPELADRLLVDDTAIWDFVWELHRLSLVRVPAAGGGDNANLAETYGDCVNAIDAVVRSYAYECQRLLLGHHVPPSEAGYDAISQAVVRAFALMRRGLSSAIWSDQPELDPGQILSLSQDDSRDAHLAGLSQVLTAIDEKLFGTTAKVPLAIILRRLRKLLEADTNATLRFRVSDLFRPLFWPDAQERRGKNSIFMSRVPWEDLPVVGMTLYDAAAYAAWVRMTTKLPVVLPSEAEYEKAFSWDLAGGDALTAERKHIYPWQGRNTLDFNQWFSRDGHSLQTIEARAAAYQKLLEDTARVIGTTGKLYQGLGFGWQWTRERFNEFERKYNRFEHAGCLKRTLQGKTICEYRDVGDHNCSFFAVRGAPDQLGGPGTVTRRFALFPLRGYSECGFRCVVSPAGEL